ncbi:MAG: hypothetical protein ACRC33_05730 [Gemmataceae bacterium]
MTSLSRRKPRTTPPGRTRTARTWASLGLLLCAALAPAQAPGPGGFVAQPVTPVRYQPSGPAALGDASPETVSVQLEPPGIGRLAQLDSDEKLQERIRQQNPTEKHVFPEPPILSRDTFAGRGALWQKRQMTVEPNFVCYGKLQSLFEETNGERYGWDLGPLSIPVSLAKFGADTVLFPMKATADPCRSHECSAGHCLPGDPVPYLIYPHEVTLTNTAAQVAVIAALIVIFP